MIEKGRVRVGMFSLIDVFIYKLIRASVVFGKWALSRPWFIYQTILLISKMMENVDIYIDTKMDMMIFYTRITGKKRKEERNMNEILKDT